MAVGRVGRREGRGARAAQRAVRHRVRRERAGEAPGAWVSGSPSSPGVLLLDTEARAPPPPEGKAKPKGAPADACKLASFSFALADAVLVHAPCVAPSADELRAAYEEYFTQHLSVLSSKEGAPPAARTLLVHVAAAGEDGGEGAWRDAAAAAWAAAVAPTELKDAEMGAHFDLEYAALPHPKLQPAEFAAAAAELRRGSAAPRLRVFEGPPPRHLRRRAARRRGSRRRRRSTASRRRLGSRSGSGRRARTRAATRWGSRRSRRWRSWWAGTRSSSTSARRRARSSPTRWRPSTAASPTAATARRR